MNEEFYATLKLISGEELFAQVCGVVENNRVFVILYHPIKLTTTLGLHSAMKTIKVYPWNELTTEDIFTIPREHIMMITESQDESLIHIHQRYIREMNQEKPTNISSHSKITSDMGYVSNVKDAVNLLEKLYQMDPTSSSEPQN